MIFNSSSRPFVRATRESALYCGKVSLEALAKKFGTPLYVYSGDQIVERLGLFEQALKGREHLICYAAVSYTHLDVYKRQLECQPRTWRAGRARVEKS